ncbi:MAG: hypothetical protein QF535_04300, partial [Anaerolineales bacterium]|nr:hypothetical protein [Anaerolineales bacterium]
MRHEAILNLYPNVVIVDDTAGCFDADGNPVAITQSLVDAEVARLQAEYDSQEYARNRQAEYPEIGDQLDMLWHAIDTGDWTAAKVKTTEFYTALKAVKDA